MSGDISDSRVYISQDAAATTATTTYNHPHYDHSHLDPSAAFMEAAAVAAAAAAASYDHRRLTAAAAVASHLPLDNYTAPSLNYTPTQPLPEIRGQSNLHYNSAAYPPHHHQFNNNYDRKSAFASVDGVSYNYSDIPASHSHHFDVPSTEENRFTDLSSYVNQQTNSMDVQRSQAGGVPTYYYSDRLNNDPYHLPQYKHSDSEVRFSSAAGASFTCGNETSYSTQLAEHTETTTTTLTKLSIQQLNNSHNQFGDGLGVTAKTPAGFSECSISPIPVDVTSVDNFCLDIDGNDLDVEVSHDLQQGMRATAADHVNPQQTVARGSQTPLDVVASPVDPGSVQNSILSVGHTSPALTDEDIDCANSYTQEAAASHSIQMPTPIFAPTITSNQLDNSQLLASELPPPPYGLSGSYHLYPNYFNYPRYNYFQWQTFAHQSSSTARHDYWPGNHEQPDPDTLPSISILTSHSNAPCSLTNTAPAVSESQMKPSFSYVSLPHHYEHLHQQQAAAAIAAAGSRSYESQQQLHTSGPEHVPSSTSAGLHVDYNTYHHCGSSYYYPMIGIRGNQADATPYRCQTMHSAENNSDYHVYRANTVSTRYGEGGGVTQMGEVAKLDDNASDNASRGTSDCTESLISLQSVANGSNNSISSETNNQLEENDEGHLQDDNSLEFVMNETLFTSEKSNIPSAYQVGNIYTTPNVSNNKNMSECADALVKAPALQQSSKNGTKRKLKSRSNQLKKSHTCSYCGMSFHYKTVLQNHERIHTGEKPYKCSVCQAAFARSAYLSNHMRTHTGERPYKCEHCGSAFMQNAHLLAHKRIHTGERKYECGVCQKRFLHAHNLKVHKAFHNSVKRYKCEECEHEFYSKTELKRHKVVHKKHRTFFCSKCPKTFPSNKLLRKHIPVHRVHYQKQWKCSVCAERFTNVCLLRNHKKIHKVKPFHCDLCKTSFSIQKTYEKHLTLSSHERSVKIQSNKEKKASEIAELTAAVHISVAAHLKHLQR